MSTQGPGLVDTSEPGDVDALLQEAMGLHRAGKLDEAEPLYARIVERAPGNADGWHFFGMLKAQRGEPGEAVVAMERSLALNGTIAGWHSNLGNVLRALERDDEAANAYERALALEEDPLALNNLGSLRRAQGRLDDAEDAFKRALGRHPRFGEAWRNLANLMLDLGRLHEAEAVQRHVLMIEPMTKETRPQHARFFVVFGAHDVAAKIFRDWIEEDPDDPYPRLHLAAITGEEVPERASDGYVERIFDNFASSFDGKLKELEYRAPHRVAERVRELVGAPDGTRDVLDLGCGTGLCGPLLRPFARRLVGVDLSKKMLLRASPRATYDHLEHAEATAYLEAHARAYDLVVSADVLCYFGRLDTVTNAALASLREGGSLVFTVEALDEGANPAGYHLHPHGRYSHARSYLARVLTEAGFEATSIGETVLRKELGDDVRGFVVSARRPRG